MGVAVWAILRSVLRLSTRTNMTTDEAHSRAIHRTRDPLPRRLISLLLWNNWYTLGGTTAVLHYDDYENLLCQVRGTKELVIFPPKDLENLYYVGRRKGKLKYDFPGKWTRYAHQSAACVDT